MHFKNSKLHLTFIYHKNMFLLHLKFFISLLMPKCQSTGVSSLRSICHYLGTEIRSGVSKGGATESRTSKDNMFLKYLAAVSGWNKAPASLVLDKTWMVLEPMQKWVQETVSANRPCTGSCCSDIYQRVRLQKRRWIRKANFFPLSSSMSQFIANI